MFDPLPNKYTTQPSSRMLSAIPRKLETQMKSALVFNTFTIQVALEVTITYYRGKGEVIVAGFSRALALFYKR